MNQTLIAPYLEAAPAQQVACMRLLLSWLEAEVPAVHVQIKWSRPVFGTTHDFAYFKSTKKHLSLGFMKGEGLPDPLGLLEGDGKDMRHIKLYEPGTMPEAQIREWLRLAAKQL
ncbi:MAG: DUF1801 domain-containing protein [Sphingobacteriaceae bacterium]|nr:DUF1801 domain-containing protein [Sphingobacteriaceae bacterium]